MATLAQLLASIEPLTPMIPRRLREAGAGLTNATTGVMEAGPVGRGQFHRSFDEAAAVAVGALTSPTPTQAGKFAKEYLAARRKHGSVVNEGVLDQTDLYRLSYDALSKDSLKECLTLFIKHWRVLEQGIEIAEQIAILNKPNKDWKAALSFEFTADLWYNVTVELAIVDRSDRSAETFSRQPLHLFIMESQFVGARIGDPAKEWDKPFGGPHTETWTFDHRVLIALGKCLDGVA